MKKKISIIAVIICCFGFSYLNVIKSGIKDLRFLLSMSSETLANAEAIDGEGNPEEDEFKYYIYKDSCKVKANTTTKLESLNRVLRSLGLGDVSLNVTVDLTDFTCLYSMTPNDNAPVRLGTDKRCTDIWSDN